MNNLRFTGAIFDMDGTIIDSMALWKNMAWGIFEENDLQIPKNLEENIYSMTFLDAAKYCIQISNTDKKAEELVCDWEMRALDFYDTKIEDYTQQYGDPYEIFKDDPTIKNRESIKKFVKTDGDE